MHSTDIANQASTLGVVESSSQQQSNIPAHLSSSDHSDNKMEGPTTPVTPRKDERRNLFDMISGGLRRKKTNTSRCSEIQSQVTEPREEACNCSPASTEAASNSADAIEDTSASSASTRFTNSPDQLNNSSCHALYNGAVNKLGEAEGQGQLIWTNGDRYVGAFFNGKQHGQGTLFFCDGAQYMGNWECGNMHGQGAHHLNNGDVFIGNFANGLRNGQGTMTFANGDKYVGQWQEGRMHGLGRYYYTNGQSFEGFFQMGKRHGQGKHQFPDGSVLVHKYVQDERVGEGVLWSADRKRVWRMVGSTRKGRINLHQANIIMLRCEEL